MKTQNLWNRFKLSNHKENASNNLKLHFEEGIDPELKKQYIKLAKWLRRTYYFPTVLNVYIVDSEKIRLGNGKWAYGSFKWFAKRPPRIKIPSAAESSLKEKYSSDDINEMVLSSFIHEITHYFQWFEGIDQTDCVSERQADYYRYRILDGFYCENK